MSKYDPKHMGGKLPKRGSKVAVARVTTAALIASMVANPLLAPVAAFAAKPGEDVTGTLDAATFKAVRAARASQAATNAESTPAKDAAIQSRSVEETQREMQGAQLDVVDATHFVDQSATAHQQATYVSDAAKQQAQAQLDELQRRADELQGQLQEATAKQAEYQKAVEAKDAAEQDKAAKDKALSEAQTKLDEAKQELDAAQAEADKLKPEELEAAKAAYEQAKAEADQAVAAQRAADKAVTDAQTQIDALAAQKQQADAAVTDAQAAQQAAQQQLASAQAAYDAAKQAYDAAAGEANADEVAQQVADAKAKLDAATTALAAAKDADAAAKAALTQANGNVESLTTQLSAAQAEQQKAQQAYDEANAAYGDKAAALEAAQKAYDEAKASEGEKQKAYEAAQADFDAKHKVYMDLSAKYQEASTEYNAAADKVNAINKQIDELRESSDEYKKLADKGTVGFMEYIQSGSLFTAQQKQNASEALAMLKGEDKKAGWYDDYVQLKGESSPMSLENLQNALTYMDAINNIRVANGLEAMKVNISSMAGSMLNACYSSNVWGHASNSGQGSYMSGCENLAGGSGAYTGSSEIDKFGWPFTGWYTSERALMIEAAGKAGLTVPTDETQMYQFYKENSEALSKNGAPFIEIGHYINFINPSYKSFGVGTGTGKDGNRETDEDDGKPFGVTIYQGSWEDGDFTVAEFKKLADEYVNSAFKDEATLQKLRDLQEQLAAAQGESSEAFNVFDEASSKLYDFGDSLDAAYETRESAKTAYEQAQATTVTAKAVYDKANADAGNGAVTQAKQALDAANAKVSGIQSKLDAAKKDAQAKKAAADAKAAALKTAQTAFDNAKATYDKLAEEHASLIDAQSKLSAASEKLDAAEKQASSADAALTDAQAKAQDLADKLAAAKADFAAKKQAAADAVAVAKRAEATLRQATKDYQVGLNLEQATAEHEAAVADVATKKQAATDAAAVLEAASAKVAPAFAAYDQAYATLRGGLKLVNTLQAGFDAFFKQNVKPTEQQPGKTIQAPSQQTPAGKHFKKASANKKAADKADLPQTGDANGLIGETFVIGGVTLIAAGVVLDGRRRRQN